MTQIQHEKDQLESTDLIVILEVAFLTKEELKLNKGRLSNNS